MEFVSYARKTLRLPVILVVVEQSGGAKDPHPLHAFVPANEIIAFLTTFLSLGLWLATNAAWDAACQPAVY